MVKIELRDDGWFEVGKDKNPAVLIASVIYIHKQELKKHLEKIGEVSSRKDLESALRRIPDIKFFEGKPFLVGDDIYIFKDEGIGDAYLGKIVD